MPFKLARTRGYESSSHPNMADFGHIYGTETLRDGQEFKKKNTFLFFKSRGSGAIFPQAF